jgi:hypothetical protein
MGLTGRRYCRLSLKEGDVTQEGSDKLHFSIHEQECRQHTFHCATFLIMNMRSIIAWAIASFSFKAFARPESVYGAHHLTHSGQAQTSYDYVIIGGGTAGLTVADRLTEDGKCLQS